MKKEEKRRVMQALVIAEQRALLEWAEERVSRPDPNSWTLYFTEEHRRAAARGWLRKHFSEPLT